MYYKDLVQLYLLIADLLSNEENHDPIFMCDEHSKTFNSLMGVYATYHTMKQGPCIICGKEESYGMIEVMRNNPYITVWVDLDGEE